LKDGAFHDAVLFLTGVSIAFYVVTRWDRAKYPILGVVGAIVLISVAILVSGLTAPLPKKPTSAPTPAPAPEIFIDFTRVNRVELKRAHRSV